MKNFKQDSSLFKMLITLPSVYLGESDMVKVLKYSFSSWLSRHGWMIDTPEDFLDSPLDKKLSNEFLIEIWGESCSMADSMFLALQQEHKSSL